MQSKNSQNPRHAKFRWVGESNELILGPDLAGTKFEILPRVAYQVVGEYTGSITICTGSITICTGSITICSSNIKNVDV